MIYLLLALYVLSVIRNYFWFKNAYSKGGTWSELKPGVIDIFWTLAPFVNTIFALQVSAVSLSGKESRSDTSNFFRINK